MEFIFLINNQREYKQTFQFGESVGSSISSLLNWISETMHHMLPLVVQRDWPRKTTKQLNALYLPTLRWNITDWAGWLSRIGTGKSQTEGEQGSCLGAPIKRVHLVFAYEYVSRRIPLFHHFFRRVLSTFINFVLHSRGGGSIGTVHGIDRDKTTLTARPPSLC